jgi:hypothetical protein
MKDVIVAVFIAMLSFTWVGCAAVNTECHPLSDMEMFSKELDRVLPQEPLKGELGEYVRAHNTYISAPINNPKICEFRYTTEVCGDKLDIVRYSIDGEIIAVEGHGRPHVDPISDITDDQVSSIEYGSGDPRSDQGRAILLQQNTDVKAICNSLRQHSRVEYNEFKWRNVLNPDGTLNRGEGYIWDTAGVDGCTIGFYLHLRDGKTLQLGGHAEGGSYTVSHGDVYFTFTNEDLYLLLKSITKRSDIQ